MFPKYKNKLRIINILVKNSPDIINQEKDGTLSTILYNGENMIVIYDRRKKSREGGEIKPGQALTESYRGTYDGFDAVYLHLHNTKYRKNADLKMILDGKKLELTTKRKKHGPIYKILLFLIKHLSKY